MMDVWDAPPIHGATWNGHTATVELLVKRGADAYALDEDGWMTLHFAALSGYTSMVKVFLERGL